MEHDAHTSPDAEPAKKKRDPESSKRRILEAAQRAFARRGYDGARLREIAQQAGVHHALVHHYFGDKKGLFRAVMEHGFAETSTGSIRLFRESAASEDLLRSAVDYFVDRFSRNRDIISIIESAVRDEGSVAQRIVLETFHQQIDPAFRTARERLEEAQQAKLVRDDIDASYLAIMALGAIVFRFRLVADPAVLQQTNKLAEEELEEYKQALMKFLTAALQP